jgi:hypothetical protein
MNYFFCSKKFATLFPSLACSVLLFISPRSVHAVDCDVQITNDCTIPRKYLEGVFRVYRNVASGTIEYKNARLSGLEIDEPYDSRLWSDDKCVPIYLVQVPGTVIQNRRYPVTVVGGEYGNNPYNPNCTKERLEASTIFFSMSRNGTGSGSLDVSYNWANKAGIAGGSGGRKRFPLIQPGIYPITKTNSLSR